ncbi:MAG TPA: response regulator [Anaerohalosphaeraceae bacterium]|nr:response regulator [Anaerohalosphaeraceae bacterium]HOL89404.1 response regulator [Anaerohalosphaeraceae bacterium]HPP55600.1 response regulator [Anaerohalosphaeraceae bacterium]
MAERKALVVDDEFHIVQVVAIKLRNNGFEVFTADNGSQAYQLACTHHPDIIVTDYQMPAMTGLELIEKLRKNPDTADTPVLLLTARGFAIDPQQKESLRVAACLSKPFSPREVLHCIEEVLAQRAGV